ncbi:amidohydrolase family protein [Tabrizicola sp.]|uniref:amidohydrolase family protein n=1 Tax=Tabrizicola sp. TaxID=2005166 RepID=UPI002FDD11F4
MIRIDAHCHFWDPARGDYGWLDAGPPALDPLRRVFTPDDLAGLNGTRRVVAVQAADSVAETRYLLDLAALNPQIAGVVGWVDLARPETTETLADLARNPRLKGIRPMLQDLPEDDWILTRPAPATLRAVQDLGLRFDALVLTRHLPHLARFTASWPDLPLIIDHCAKPRMDSPQPAWAEGMAAMAAFPHVHCKLSGLMTELPEALRQPEIALAAMRPVVDQVLHLFGPDRLLWGSDWPVLTLAATHQVWEQLTDRLLEGLTPTERAAILGGNAITFYGLEGDT